MNGRMRRWRRPALVPYLFFLPFALLAVQYAIIADGLGEPYPALMMPSFSGTLTNSGTITFRVIEVEVRFLDGGASEHPALSTILAPMPSGTLMPTCAYVFRSHPITPDPPRPRAGIKDWLVDHLLPRRGRRFRQLRAGNPLSSDAVAWLRQRVGQVYPGRTARSVTFLWYQDSYRVAGGRFNRVDHRLAEKAQVLIAP